jgi:YD repeat-containing protein
MGCCGAVASTTFTANPNTPSLMVAPATLAWNSSQGATGTVTLLAPVGGDTPVAIGQSPSSPMLYFVPTIYGECYVPRGGTQCRFTVTSAQGVSQDTKVDVLAYASGTVAKAPLLIRMANPPTANPPDLGRAKCIVSCSSPINITTGNVWIEHRDYSVPGLGGGLELSRVWNSQWLNANPPNLAGMFGAGWISTYEEQLMPLGSQNLVYWRNDGSGWTFTYNSTLNSYSIASPPDERAQLVANPTGGFTLTLPDGTQKLFNSQNKLAAVVDRNNHQTTHAYDSTNRLTSVTSAGGTVLTFSYNDSNNPMQVTTAQDSVGTVATYTYDSSSRLTMVTYADGSKLNFSFDSNSMITSVTDSQSKLLESHTYDSQRRGLTSSRANGVDSVSLTY